MYSKKTKAEASIGMLIAVATAVLALISLMIVLNLLGQGAKNELESQKCRNQVMAHTAGLRLTGRMLATQIDCPTRLVEINTKKQKEAKNTIAEEMRKCWYSFAEGKHNLFKDEYTFCHPCSVLFLEGDENVKGLTTYLKDTDMPRSKIKYLEYLQGYTSSDEAEDIQKLRDSMKILTEEQKNSFAKESLDASKNYAVVFVYAKGDENMKKVWEHLTLQTTAGKIGATGALVTGIAAPLGTIAVATAIRTSIYAVTLGIAGGIGIATPPGWVLLGATIIGAGAAEVFSFKWSKEADPEWVALTILMENDAENFQGLGCQYEPIPINKK